MAKTKLKKLRVPYVPGLPSLPIYVADDQKIFQKYGFKPKLTNVGGDFGNAVKNVAEGKADLTFVATFFVLETAIKNPGSLLIPQHEVCTKVPPTVYGLLVKKGSKIRKPKQIRGKKVAVFPAQAPGTKQGLFEAYAYSLAKDLKAFPINTDPFAGVVALAEGKVDALLTLEPIASIGAETIGGRLVGKAPLAEVLPVIPTGAAVVSKKRSVSNPKFTRGITAALDDAVDFIRASSPDLIAKIYTKYGSLPPQFQYLADRFVLNYWKSTEIGKSQIGSSQTYADYLRKNGVITGSIKVKSLYRRGKAGRPRKGRAA